MKIIKHYGRPKEAYDLNGQRVERKDKVYVKSYHGWFFTMDYDNHFVYMSNRLGSTMMCTCGSPAVVVEWPVYRTYHSDNIGPMMVCMYHMQNGRHADGSS